MNAPSFGRISLEKIVCDDGLELDGIVARPQDSQVVVVHVHGKCGNFYQNAFISNMLSVYPERGIAFASFNSRGHDCVAEGYRDGSLTYVGGSLERRHDELLDLTAYQRFVEKEWPNARVVYQGHSLGCDRVAYFARAGLTDAHLVLLSPSDSRALQVDYVRSQSGGDQAERLSGFESDAKAMLLLRDEYGVRYGDSGYDIPVERRALLDLIRGRSLDTFGQDAKAVANPTLVYLGLCDPLVGLDLDEWRERLERQFEISRWLIVDADHHFRGHETVVANAIVDWIEETAG